jgi:hypothetical protein
MREAYGGDVTADVSFNADDVGEARAALLHAEK